MLMIRLQRVGRKNQPSFRLVLTDSKNAAKSGKFIEILGSHNYRKEDTVLKGERINHWIKMGAQLSDSAHNLLVSNKIISGKKINVLPKKTAPVKEVVEEVVVEAAPVAAPAPTPAEEVLAAPVVEEVVEAPVVEESAPAPTEAPVEEVEVVA